MFFRHASIPLIIAASLCSTGCGKKKEEGKPGQIRTEAPESAPAPIKEPHQILAHLKYLAIRQDMGHLATLDPQEEKVSLGAANWFNTHSGDCNLALTEEEITRFGLEELEKQGLIATMARNELEKRLDEEKTKAQKASKGRKKTKHSLPPELEGLTPDRLDFPTNAGKTIWEQELKPALEKHRKALFQAGLWRLLKGVPKELWSQVNVMGVFPNPDPKVKNVNLGIQGQLMIELGLYQRPDQSYGLCYWYYKVHPKTLQREAKKLQLGPTN